MDKDKKSFLMYFEYKKHFALLSNEQLGELVRAIFIYLETDIEPDLPDISKMAFSFIKANLDREYQNWIETKNKRSEAGKKGMESRYGKSKKQNKSITKGNNVIKDNNNVKKNDNKKQQSITNVTVKVKEKVKGKVNVNDKVNKNESENVNVNVEQVDTSLSKFIKAFPNKKPNGKLQDEQSMDTLISAVNNSDFLKTNHNLDLKWLVEHYDKVVNDNYKTWENTKQKESQLEKAARRLKEEIPYAN